MCENEDYCPEEEEKEEEIEVVSGPICEVCGKPSDSIYECYVKRELRGRFEMVKIFLCALHFMEQIAIDSVPPPPEDEAHSIDDLWKEFMEHFGGPDDDDEDDDEDGNGGGLRKKSNVDRENQSFG
jgi:hypothetical protein